MNRFFISILVTLSLLSISFSSFAHRYCKKWETKMVGFPNAKGDVTFNARMKILAKKRWKLISVKFDDNYFTLFIYRCNKR